MNLHNFQLNASSEKNYLTIGKHLNSLSRTAVNIQLSIHDTDEKLPVSIAIRPWKHCRTLPFFHRRPVSGTVILQNITSTWTNCHLTVNRHYQMSRMSSLPTLRVHNIKRLRFNVQEKKLPMGATNDLNIKKCITATAISLRIYWRIHMSLKLHREIDNKFGHIQSQAQHHNQPHPVLAIVPCRNMLQALTPADLL